MPTTDDILCLTLCDRLPKTFSDSQRGYNHTAWLPPTTAKNVLPPGIKVLCWLSLLFKLLFSFCVCFLCSRSTSQKQFTQKARLAPSVWSQLPLEDSNFASNGKMITMPCRAYWQQCYPEPGCTWKLSLKRDEQGIAFSSLSIVFRCSFRALISTCSYGTERHVPCALLPQTAENNRVNGSAGREQAHECIRHISFGFGLVLFPLFSILAFAAYTIPCNVEHEFTVKNQSRNLVRLVILFFGRACGCAAKHNFYPPPVQWARVTQCSKHSNFCLLR